MRSRLRELLRRHSDTIIAVLIVVVLLVLEWTGIVPPIDFNDR